MLSRSPCILGCSVTYFLQRSIEISSRVNLIMSCPYALGINIPLLLLLARPSLLLCLFTVHQLIGLWVSLVLCSPAVLVCSLFLAASLCVGFEDAGSDFLGESHRLPRTLDLHIPQPALTCLFCIWARLWAGHWGRLSVGYIWAKKKQRDRVRWGWARCCGRRAERTGWGGRISSTASPKGWLVWPYSAC